MKTIKLLGFLALGALLLWLPEASERPELVHAEAKVEKERVVTRSLSSAPKTLDPHKAGDVVSSTQCGMVYEGLYEYELFTRPYRLKPCLAKAMPTVSKDGLTYEIPLRDDVFFQDNACFPNGKGRKMLASDVAYSIKRFATLADTPGWWILNGKIEGLNDLRQETTGILQRSRFAGEKAMFDFLTKQRLKPVKGLVADDEKGIIKITLTSPYQQFLYVSTMSYLHVMPKEADAHYLSKVFSNPVGTGPYRLESWDLKSGIEWVASPNYRKVLYPEVPAKLLDNGEFDSRERYLPFVGKRLPISDRISFAIIQSNSLHWKAFMSGELSASGISSDLFERVFPDGKGQLSKELRKKKIRAHIFDRPIIEYFVFNMNDPVVGAKAGKKGKAIRQAFSYAFDRKAYIKDVLSGRGKVTSNLVAPGVSGFDATSPINTTFDATKGRKILTDAGFKLAQDAEGNWTAKDPTTGAQVGFTMLMRGTRGTTLKMAKMVEKAGALIGLKVTAEPLQFPEFLRRQRKAEGQSYNAGWVFDYPDATNIFLLLYGKNAVESGVNAARFKNKEYDALFEKVDALDPNDAEQAIDRAKAIKEMNKILADETPWIPIYFGQTYALLQDWYTPAPANEFAFNLGKYHAGKLVPVLR